MPTEITIIELAALYKGYTVTELLSFKEYPDHVAIIAPTGQKFTIANDELYNFAKSFNAGSSLPAISVARSQRDPKSKLSKSSKSKL